MFEHWQKTCCFLTRRCNLKCRGCNVINHQTSAELSTRQWCDAFDIMKDRGVGFIVLFGGEPTLRDDLPDMISHLNSISMPHTIITNGSRLLKSAKLGTEYYQRLLDSKPYGISASVNVLKAVGDCYHDNMKSKYGASLLFQLKKDLPECDLVANMAVTRKNILELPKMVEHFTEKGIWSILSFFHVCPPGESLHWWYRGPLTEQNKELVFQSSSAVDKYIVETTANWFIKNYDRLKLHNQKSYFEAWPKFGIHQNWNCSYWACPAINPDGSLMACIDRPLVRPFSIFDLKDSIHDERIYKAFEETIRNCQRGCFWDHHWETNKYAAENQADVGKKKFAHKEE